MYRLILEDKNDYNFSSFAFCRSCYWTATIFTNMESYECPVCRDQNVDLIPLNLDEKYEYQVEPNKGLEIKFWIKF